MAEQETKRMKKKEQWSVRNWAADFAAIAVKCGVSPIVARLMINRGTTEEEAYTYFHGGLENLEEPEHMKDMEKAVRLLEDAITKKEKIAIASDYDCDGLFSGFSLYRLVTILGGNAELYIPDRVTEGYGLNRRIVKEALADGCRLLITSDNGIAAIEEVQFAKEKGLTVIVTDHHEVKYEELPDGTRTFLLPEADAVVNPHQSDCPYRYKKLCGTGIVFQMARYLLGMHGMAESYETEFLEYAAIATVADVVDLSGENRIIVKSGLKHLQHTENTGLRAMLQVCDLEDRSINSYHIGFIIAPTFNAVGRLGSMKQGVELLAETDPEKALEYAGQLRQLNEKRQRMTDEGFLQAVRLVEEEGSRDEWNQYIGEQVLFICLPKLHESIAGIVAGRLRERYAHPVFVMTKDAHGGLKGSGRSIEGYHMFEGLMKVKDWLGHFGGHPMAAGVSIPVENYEMVKHSVNEQAGLSEDDFVEKVLVDMELPFRYCTEELCQEMQKLEPYGTGNEKPLFGVLNVEVLSYNVLGKNKNVMKLLLRDPQGGRKEAICFSYPPADFEQEITERYGERELDAMKRGAANKVRLNLVFYPDINEFRGRRTIQLVVTNIKYA